MYDTTITVLGNVATSPSCKQLANGALTEFKVASTSRRFDKRLDKWVDGDELFVRVSCWRTLATNVHESVNLGDPVVVRGRLFSRRHVDDTGTTRYFYEINAQSVGHDLSRGVSDFTRVPHPGGFGERSSHSGLDALVDAMPVAQAEQPRSPAALAGV